MEAPFRTESNEAGIKPILERRAAQAAGRTVNTVQVATLTGVEVDETITIGGHLRQKTEFDAIELETFGALGAWGNRLCPFERDMSGSIARFRPGRP